MTVRADRASTGSALAGLTAALSMIPVPPALSLSKGGLKGSVRANRASESSALAGLLMARLAIAGAAVPRW
jgi:hypothetical protein